MTKIENDILKGIQRDIEAIRTTLLGSPNTADNGLYGWVVSHERRLARLERALWMLVALLTGLGILTGVNLLGG